MKVCVFLFWFIEVLGEVNYCGEGIKREEGVSVGWLS